MLCREQGNVLGLSMFNATQSDIRQACGFPSEDYRGKSEKATTGLRRCSLDQGMLNDPPSVWAKAVGSKLSLGKLCLTLLMILLLLLLLLLLQLATLWLC